MKEVPRRIKLQIAALWTHSFLTPLYSEQTDDKQTRRFIYTIYLVDIVARQWIRKQVLLLFRLVCMLCTTAKVTYVGRKPRGMKCFYASFMHRSESNIHLQQYSCRYKRSICLSQSTANVSIHGFINRVVRFWPLHKSHAIYILPCLCYSSPAKLANNTVI